MSFNQRERIRLLRALGAPGSGTTDAERKLANDKADELERKYGKLNSPATDTKITGVSYHGTRTFQDAFDILERLLNDQWQWNDQYYDRHGNPRPNRADEDDLYEEAYKYDPDYDAIGEDE